MSERNDELLAYGKEIGIDNLTVAELINSHYKLRVLIAKLEEHWREELSRGYERGYAHGKTRAIRMQDRSWENAVLSRLASLHISGEPYESDPDAALDMLIQMECGMALDPAISPEARRLGGRAMKALRMIDAMVGACADASEQARRESATVDLLARVAIVAKEALEGKK